VSSRFKKFYVQCIPLAFPIFLIFPSFSWLFSPVCLLFPPRVPLSSFPGERNECINNLVLIRPFSCRSALPLFLFLILPFSRPSSSSPGTVRGEIQSQRKRSPFSDYPFVRRPHVEGSVVFEFFFSLPHFPALSAPFSISPDLVPAMAALVQREKSPRFTTVPFSKITPFFYSCLPSRMTVPHHHTTVGTFSNLLAKYARLCFPKGKSFFLPYYFCGPE